MQKNTPTLIITFGYPGSGKTYFSERLAKNSNFFHLSSDKIRSAMFPNPEYTKEEHAIVFGFIDFLVQELLTKGVSIVYDANFNFGKNRMGMQKLAKKVGANYKIVWIKTNEKTAINRLEQRATLKSKKRKEFYKPIDVTVFHELRKEMEFPTKTEPVIEINGHLPFLKQYEVFIKKISL